MRNTTLLIFCLIGICLASTPSQNQQTCPNTFIQYDNEKLKCHTKIKNVAQTMQFIEEGNEAADICFNGTEMLILFGSEISRPSIEELCLISARIYRSSLSNIEDCEWILSSRQYNVPIENKGKPQSTKELTMELKKIVQVKYRLAMLNLILVGREYPKLKENITGLMDEFDNAGQFNEFSSTLRMLIQE